MGRKRRVDNPLDAQRATSWALKRQKQSEGGKKAIRKFPRIIPGKKGFQSKQQLIDHYGNLEALNPNSTVALAIPYDNFVPRETFTNSPPELSSNANAKKLANDNATLESENIDTSQGDNLRRSGALTSEERYILDEGAKDIALWGATLFPHHITHAFAPFHKEMLGLLRSAVVGVVPHNERSVDGTLKINVSSAGLPPVDDGHNIQQIQYVANITQTLNVEHNDIAAPTPGYASNDATHPFYIF